MRMGSTAAHNQCDALLGTPFVRTWSSSQKFEHDNILSTCGRKVFHNLAFAELLLSRSNKQSSHLRGGCPRDGICCLVEGQTSRRR